MENNVTTLLSSPLLIELRELSARINDAYLSETAYGTTFRDAIKSLAIAIGSEYRLREILSTEALSTPERISAATLLEEVHPSCNLIHSRTLTIPIDRRIFIKNIVAYAEAATQAIVESIQLRDAGTPCLQEAIGFKKILEATQNNAIEIGKRGQKLINRLDNIIHAIESKNFDVDIGNESSDGCRQPLLPFLTPAS